MKPAARAVAFAAMASTLCASVAFADDAAQAPVRSDASHALRVVIDPETGKLRAPTAAELQAQTERKNAAAASKAAPSAARAASRKSNQILPGQKELRHHANGMSSVRLSHESLSLLKATTANGKVEVLHEGEVVQRAAEEK